MDGVEQRGFAHAKLLIVVAIIAVLVAIAVPLFVGALDKANDAVFQSNKHAVKSAGIAAILSDKDYDLSKLTSTNKYIKVTGTFDDDGDTLTNVEVAKEPTTTKADETADYDAWKTADKKTIIVYVEAADLTTES